MEKLLKRCDHYGKRGHLKDECFKIKGAPEWYENLQKQRNKQATNVGREQGSYEDNAPLDAISEKGKGSVNKVESAMISAVVQES